MVTTATEIMIANGLRSLGICGGDFIMIHSSLKSFGQVEKGAESVVNAALAAAGENGLVMFPAITGTESMNASTLPVFDMRSASTWTGAVPRYTLADSRFIRSAHPTHSVTVAGFGREEIIAGHEYCLTPCAADSPYGKLAARNGKVIMMGCSLESCTMLHCAEEIAGIEYHLQREPVEATVIHYDGGITHHRLYLHAWGTPRRFENIRPLLVGRNAITSGKIGEAHIDVINARELVDCAVTALKSNNKFLLQNGIGG